MKKSLYITLFFLFLFNFNFGQEKLDYKKINTFYAKVDSLININQDAITAEKELIKLKKSPNYNKDQFEGDFHYKYSTIYTIKKEYNKAIRSCNLALIEFKKHNDILKIGSVNYTLGEIYSEINNKFLALKKYQEAERHFLPKNLYLIYNAYANIYSELNDSRTAIYYALKSKEISIKNKDSVALFDLNNTLGNIYFKNEDYSKSLSYFKQSLRISELKKINNFIFNSKNNIGSIYLKQKKIILAKNTFKEAEIYLSKSNFINIELGELLFNQATIELELKNPSKAMELSKKSMSIAEKFNSELYKCKNHLLLSKIYSSTQNTTQALNHLKSASSIASNNNYNDLLESVYFDQAKLYENLNPSTSIIFFKKYISIKEKNLLLKQKNNLENIEIKNKILDYKNEIKLKNQEVQLLTLKNDQFVYQIFIAISIIIALGIFVYKQYKTLNIKKKNVEYLKEISKLKEEKYNTELNFKNTQVTEFALQIQEQNNLLSEIKSKLQLVKKHVKDNTPNDQITAIQILINDTINVNNEKVELNKEIKNNQESFLFNLKNKYPSLTDKEIQIAIYLRLNFNTKQISSQLNIIEQSVNNYRASIRRKLNIDKNVNLNQFLNEI